ncbi:MAG: phosphate ABC transporter substrate-binding protein PstS [Microlunatus sp.]
MKISRTGAAATLATAAVLALSSCAANETAAPTDPSGSSVSGLSGTLTGIGASSAATAQETWVAVFQTKNPGVTVNYSPDGSGAGREAFAGGGADFAGSDRAMKPAEMTAEALAKSRCDASRGALNLPIYISPIAIVYHVEGVDNLRLDAATLAGIFAGKITKWNDPKIVALNPDAKLPAQAITPVHRADDSGTTQNLTEYLNAVTPSVWSYEPSGEWPVKGGEAAPQTSGMVDTVSNGTGTIGYADASRAGELSVAKIRVGDKYAEPTAEAAAAIVDKSKRLTDGRSANDWSIELDRKATGDVYPIVLLSYAIACQKYTDAATAEKVRAYLSYVASEAGQQDAVKTAKMAPLSAELSADVEAAAATIS